MHRVPVTSTNVASVGYDGFRQVLEVEFLDGRVYQYYGVPMAVYHEIISGPPGHVLDALVKKPGVPYKRIQ